MEKGKYTEKSLIRIVKNVVNINGVALTLLTGSMQSINHQNYMLIILKGKDMEQLRIRKLTPLECLKLQGFSEEDYNAIKERFSDSAIYHVAGDSISVSTLMCGVFGTMTNLNYRKATQDYVETLKGDYE